MLLTQVQGAGGNARPSSPGREGALLAWHVGGTQEVGSAITTRAVLTRAQANKIEKGWCRGMARYMYEARWHLT